MYYKSMYKMFGSTELALAAYNAGPGNVKKYGGQIPPYRETKRFVNVIMQNYKDLKIYVHCRWYWPQEIAKIQNNIPNLWIWFCGNVTYPSAQNLRDSLKMVNLEKLLIETDAPYLPVKEFRGLINTPAMITHLYDFISEFLWIERNLLEKQVEENFDRLYKATS